ncbi:MAG: DUF3352 domain-containing protein [Chloroflexi bacterium]|nr:DUF3352 domain-containing protein [Chloroflexota bacterium]
MTEPRTPGDPWPDADGAPATSRPTASPDTESTSISTPAPTPTSTSASAPAPGEPAPAVDAADSPTQAWPSLSTPTVTPESTAPLPAAAAPGYDPLNDGPITRPSPYEPTASLPATRVGTVEGGTPGAASPSRGRPGMRWMLALVGVLIVAAVSFLIVSLVGGRPATSTAMSYMPTNTFSYSEVRLDLPGDQRTKVASFLKAFPGFTDQSQIEPKLNELLDRIVSSASDGKQTWTRDIQPWFGGQISLGVGLPDSSASSMNSMSGINGSLFVATIKDRGKAIAWLTSTTESSTLNQSTYGDADLFVAAEGGGQFAAAINDKVLLAGSTTAVKAAIDSGGKGELANQDDMKAAVATLDKDYVLFSVVRIRTYADALIALAATSQPGALDNTQIDETLLGMIPAWTASTARFENDAIVASSVSPSWAIGYDTTNRPSELLGHVPAKTIAYAEIHDVGPALNAILAKFRTLPEAKPAFDQFDQALSILGGFDSAFGWWGDSALVVSSLGDGTVGAGLVVKPRDAALADRLFTTLNGFLGLAGGNQGIVVRTEDHNGTKITIIDFSASMAQSGGTLPPGYKPEFAWATTKDVSVVGYGSAFVAAVLDAGPGNSLNDDARFKALLGRVGADNIGVTFVDLAAIRAVVEPLAEAALPSDKWTYYTTEIQPYLKPLDGVISGIRKDGGLDRGNAWFTAH